MDTEKQRHCRCDDASLTESGNARSEQLNTRGAYRVANQQSLACLSGSERRRPFFLNMKYQTCSMSLHCARSMGWVFFSVNFRPLQEIKAKYGGWVDILALALTYPNHCPASCQTSNHFIDYMCNHLSSKSDVSYLKTS